MPPISVFFPGKLLSEMLISELALRDELEYDKVGLANTVVCLDR